jgi:lipopolysaccharide/colanic/teichoic acid biosynthesis glycosyltransferase
MDSAWIGSHRRMPNSHTSGPATLLPDGPSPRYASPPARSPFAAPGTEPSPPRPVIGGRRRRSSEEPIRRGLNVVVALLALLVVAPLMLLVALLVKADSRGPAIYAQRRVGLDRRGRPARDAGERRHSDMGGRIFTIYKFRTMTVAPEGEQKWASQEAQRITRVGRLLRATRIDELPQLVNVLKGDMNIVGPRPEQPGIFAELRQEVTGYPERQRVLPGITGWAQVNLGYDTSIDDVRRKVELDLEYIDRRSAAEDLAIMAKTMPVMVFRKGAM